MEIKQKRAQLGWYLYDFGNSAYAAVVLLAIYDTVAGSPMEKQLGAENLGF